MDMIDIMVFLLFRGGVVGLGCCLFKKKGRWEELSCGGRSLGGWVVGMWILGRYVRSMSYVGYGGKAFWGDWNG